MHVVSALGKILCTDDLCTRFRLLPEINATYVHTRVQALGFSKPQDVPSEPTKGDPASAVQLISFPNGPTCKLTSTGFGGKLEVAMRLAGIPYTGLCGDVTNPKHAPKHKACTAEVCSSMSRACHLWYRHLDAQLSTVTKHKPKPKAISAKHQLLASGAHTRLAKSQQWDRPRSVFGHGSCILAEKSTTCLADICGGDMQFPVLRHGSNVVSDSSEIFQYLLNTYTEKMKFLVPEEPDRYTLSLQ
jgi:hypothetical protein